MTLVREAMVAEPTTLESIFSAVEAGERLSQPDVRAVLVTEADGTLVGVVTRTTLVRAVVAAGRDPGSTKLVEIAEPPRFTIDADIIRERPGDDVRTAEIDSHNIGRVSWGGHDCLWRCGSGIRGTDSGY